MTDTFHRTDAGETTRMCGDFKTEAEAEAFFDRVVEGCGLFRKVCKEVSGQYLFHPAGKEIKQPRIDRILLPAPELLSMGWQHGPIGVEIKRSGGKLNTPLAQALDYQQAVFEIQPGYHIYLEWVFLFPLQTTYRLASSIMCQNRIGYCEPRYSTTWEGRIDSEDDSLTFGTGGQVMLSLSADGHVNRANSSKNGKRRGSR